MYIGEVAKQTGLSVKAIRLYEEKGLIRSPRRLGRYRVYTDEDVEVLSLIVEAKKLGVTLTEIKGAIVYRDTGVDWQRVRIFLEDVKGRLEAELENIAQSIKQVEHCIDSIESCPQTVDSPPKGRD